MSKQPPPYPTSFDPKAWSTHPLLGQSLGYPTVPSKTSCPLHFWALGWPGARKPSGQVLTKSDRHIQYDVRKKKILKTQKLLFFINKQHQKRMNSISLRSIRAKYGCLKQTSVLTNAFAAISRISSFASTFVWAHGILASSIHITSVIVSCAFLNFWKKSRRFINSHLPWLMTLLRAAYFLKWYSQLEFMEISWKEKGNYCELYKLKEWTQCFHLTLWHL